MKKYFFLLALVLAPLAFISCSDDDEGGSSSVTLKTPKTSTDAIKLEFPGKPTIKVKVDGKDKIIKVVGVELTEDAKYLLSYIDEDALPVREETRSKLSDAISYLLGNFSKDGAKYVLEQLGTLELETEGGNNYQVSFIPEGEADALVTNAVAIIFDLFPGSKQLTEYLCRTWTIKSYQVRGEINGTKLAREWNGTCDLRKVAEYANDKGADIDLGDLNGKEVIEGIFFTKGHTFQINYKNTDKKDVGEWAWTSVNANNNSGNIGYIWNGDDMGNDILCGVASVEFSGNTCKLHLYADVNTGDADNVEAVFFMQ